MITDQEILQAKILIVDDQPANVLLLEKILQKKGYTRTKSTTNPHDAARLYLDFQPDILLLDLAMPGLSGFQIMEQLREMEPDSYLPILVLTADLTQSARKQALERGAKDFITKPFDSVEVLMRIRNMLEVRLLYNQVRDHNRILEEKVEERTRALKETRLEIIHRLSLAAEYRDDLTGLHIRRMSDYSAAIAGAAGMSHAEAELLKAASKMHDIGKIRIPDRILTKPGPLTPEEWELMRTHPVVGSEILANSKSELLQLAESIALTHHEKWDGTGYPAGLKGTEIPLGGRICALGDVFDALTSRRSYRDAWPVERVVEEIVQLSGTHFDPDLVVIFHQTLPELLEIKRSYDRTEASPR